MTYVGKFLALLILLVYNNQLLKSLRHSTGYTLKNSRANPSRLYNSVSTSIMTATSKLSSIGFDFKLALLLAGFSFESYNEKLIGKKVIGLDNTIVTYSSSKFIQFMFSGLIIITLKTGSFNLQEEQFIERIVTGDKADPYIIFQVQDDFSTGRVIDSWTSSVQLNQNNPVWNEGCNLYVRSTESAYLAVTVLDKDVFKEDDIIGTGLLKISDLIQLNRTGLLSENLTIPLYAVKDADRTLWNWVMDLFGKQEKFIRSGTISVDIQLVPWKQESTQLVKKAFETSSQVVASKTEAGSILRTLKRRFPKGATEHLDWANLLDQIVTVRIPALSSTLSEDLLNSLLHASDRVSESGLHQICSIDNSDTDTQAGIWADFTSKQIVIAFRGTEQVKFKDILTDINLLQTKYEIGNPILEKALVHSGFITAFRSVRGALLQLLQTILSSTPISDNPWRIFITGHSLGGALATLMSFELARMTAGIWTPVSPREDPIQTYKRRLYFNSTRGTLSRDFIDEGSLYRNDTRFLDSLRRAEVCMYTFGAPRVGNPYFAELFDKHVHHAYRVVNNQDIVARIPRSSQIGQLLEYKHIGRAVKIDDSSLGTIWIENRNAESTKKSPQTNSFTLIPADLLSTVAEFDTTKLTDTITKSMDQQLSTFIAGAGSRFTTDVVWSGFNKVVSNVTTSLNNVTTSWNSVVDAASPLTDYIFGDDKSKTVRSTEENQKRDIIVEITELINSLSKAVAITGLEVAAITQVVQEGLAITSEQSTFSISSQSDQSEKITQSSMAISGVNAKIPSNSEKFIDREMKLLQSILDGKALEHHLEPSYYIALNKVIDFMSGNQTLSMS